jgi:NADPH:quinone reductase-like Zn-dependent oxidoreductase
VKSVRLGSGQIHLIGFVATVSQGHSLDSNETNADDNAYHQEGGDSNVIFPLIRSALSMRGIHVGSVAQYVFRHLQFLYLASVLMILIASRFKDMNRLIEANPETTKPVIDKVFPFEQAIDAYAYLESQKHVGKIVIKVAA